MHHRQQGRQRLLLAQRFQQSNPVLHIQGIGEQALDRHSLTSNRLHQVRVMTVLLQLGDDPLPQQLGQIQLQLGGINSKGREQPCPLRRGGGQERAQVQAPAPVPDDQQNSVSSPAEGIGIGRSTGSLPFGKDAQQQFQPFSEGHNGAGIARWQLIAGTPGQVMLHHCQGHRPGCTFLQQVLTAHQTLQLWELTHHLGDQIVLAQVGRLDRCRRLVLLQRQLAHQLLGNAFNPIAAVPKAAETLRERDPIQRLTPARTALTTVDGQEEFRVGQPGCQHTLVAAGDHLSGRLEAVAHQQEIRLENTFGVELKRIRLHARDLQRHITLMGLHHRADHLRRQRQKTLDDPATQHLGRLHQIHQLFKQRLRTIQRSTQVISGSVEGITNGVRPQGAIHQNACRFKTVAIGLGIVNTQRCIPMQAVPAGIAVAADRRISTGNLNRDQAGSLQSQQPADRTTEALGSAAPAHETPSLKPGDPGGNQLLQQSRTVLSHRCHRGEHAGPLRCVTNVERRRFHTAAFGEADCCRSRRSILERLRHRRSLALLGEIGLAIRKALHLHDKPAWGAVDVHLSMV